MRESRHVASSSAHRKTRGGDRVPSSVLHYEARGANSKHDTVAVGDRARRSAVRRRSARCWTRMRTRTRTA